MKTKRIKINDEDDALFNRIKKIEDINADELFSKMIHNYYADRESKTELQNQISVLEEYIKLLVKSNGNLPKEDDAMNALVDAVSRFDSIIREKVKNEN